MINADMLGGHIFKRHYLLFSPNKVIYVAKINLNQYVRFACYGIADQQRPRQAYASVPPYRSHGYLCTQRMKVQTISQGFFFLKFWEGALGPFRLGKVARLTP